MKDNSVSKKLKLESNDVNKSTKNNWSKRQWLVLVTTTSATLGCAICISLQAPFFPAEAERKHVSSTVYGFVFGVYSLTVFLIAPIIGKYIEKIGPLFLLNSGTFLTASCCILFGVLDKIKSDSSFITFAFIVRIIEATGEAAVITSSFSIAAQTFPAEINKAFAFLRAAFGVGLTIGPTVGGLLYEAGGYTLPFACMGGLLLAIALVNISLFWSDNEEYVSTRESSNIMQALSIPTVSLCMIATCIAATSIGFIETTLEPHLRQFKVSAVVVGFAFLTTAASEAISYGFLGWFADQKQYLKPIIASGHFLLGITFLLVGPAPFIPVESEFWMTIVAMAFHGLGLGAVFLATHVEALQSSILNGFSDSFQTYGMISGIWAAFFELGHFIGPSVSGVLLDMLGFRLATLIPLSVQLTLVVANMFYYFVYDVPRRKIERQDDLSSS